MSTQPPSILAPRSIDRVRLIRRSMRCFTFGCIGFIPVLGLGLAAQALRLRRSILAEVNQSWHAPHLYWLWLFGALVLWSTDDFFGPIGDSVVLFACLVAQTWLLWRRFPADCVPLWNPGHRQVFWGTALAYGGIISSAAILELLVCQLSKLDQ